MNTTKIEDEAEQDESKDKCDLEDRTEEFDFAKDPNEEHVCRECNHFRSRISSGTFDRSTLDTRELTDTNGDEDPTVEIGPILDDHGHRNPFRGDGGAWAVDRDPTYRER